MFSGHRIEKCTLQITFPPGSDLDAVRLLAQEKPRILEAILAVFDREVPEHLQISLSKIHLDLGTVSRQDLIQTLTDRLIALLSAELKRLANDPSIRTSRTNRIEPTGIEFIFDEADSSARTNLLPDESRPGVHTELLPYPAAIASQQRGAVPTDTLLAVVTQYLQTGVFPRAFKALLTTDIGILVNYLVDSKARPFADYLARRIGMTDFQLKLAERLPYDTLLAIARFLPALNTSLPAWLAWIEEVDAGGISPWKYTSAAKRLLLQYLTAPSFPEKEKIQEECRKTAVIPHPDDSALTYTIRYYHASFDSIPTPERDRLLMTKRLLHLHDLFQTYSPSPVVRHSLIEKLTLPDLRIVVKSLGIAHGSYTHWQAFVRKVKDLYTVEHAVLPDNVARTMYRRYIDLITTQHKSSVTFERLEQFLLPELQLLSDWPQAVSHPTAKRSGDGDAIRSGKMIAVSLGSNASGPAKQPDVHAFAIVRFYYRYGHFPTPAQHLRAADLEALMLYLLAGNRERLTQYILTLAGNVTFTARLADTLSVNTLKTILSAAGSVVSDALAEWNIWEQILESVIEKTTFLSFADKFALFQYISTPSGSTRGRTIYEYFLSLYAMKGLHFAPHMIMRGLLRYHDDDDTKAAALERIIVNYPFSDANQDALAALQEHLANVDEYITLETRSHPSYTHWIAFQTRMRALLTEIGVPAREEILRQLQFDFLEYLRHDREILLYEKLERHLLHRAELLLAATVPEADAGFLRVRLDASVTSATLHWRSVLEQMIRHGIRHILSKTPALRQLAAIDAVWDTALADEAAVFSLFHAAAITASFWSELSEILSFDRLHRLLSILAPFQYQGLVETGVMDEDQPTARETFSFAFTTLHDTRFAITTEKLIDRVFNQASFFIPGDALTSLSIPAASGSPDATTLPTSLLPTDNVAARLLTLLAEDISVHRTASARARWRLLYHYYRRALVSYVRAQWSWAAWRDSLALDADLGILIDLTASLLRDEPSYYIWRSFTVPYRHHERSLRAMHRYYFDFLASAHREYAPSVFTRSLADFAKTLDAQPDATLESVSGVPIEQEPAANPADIQDTKRDHAEAPIDPTPTADVVHPSDAPPPSGLSHAAAPNAPEERHSDADIIVYYLKTGLFIPGGGAANTAALTKITTRYFSEVSPNDNSVMAIAHDNPEAYRRLKPLLSPAALSLLQARGSTVKASPPHYTASRIKTLQQIEATLHYWLYEQWPWWYISTRPPIDPATTILEKHLELLTERLKTSGHEVAIVQKIASRLPQAVFLEMIGIRFPTVAGFVTRVLLLLEKMSLKGEDTSTFPLHATFAVVYDYLAHHIDPFSALHFLSVLARHSAKLINVSESVWITRMADLSAIQGNDSPYWSLHALLISLHASSTEASTIADTLQSPAVDGSSALAPPSSIEADRGFTGSTSSTFKEAFVAYLRMGIIPLHTQESGDGKSAFTRQLQVVALQEPAWLTTTLKSLFMNADTLDAYLLRSDSSITISIIESLADTRQQEFAQWARAMEIFLRTLPEKSDSATPGPFQASLLTARSLLLLLLQRPAFKITAIQYAQAVLEYSIQHHVTKGLDTLLEKIQQLKASPSISEHFVTSLKVAHAQMTTHARTLLLQSLMSPSANPERTAPAFEKGAHISVEGAGIVLIAPFFYTYFNRLEMMENNSFKSNIHAVRAVHLLHYLVSGHTEVPRHPLLYNLLCGVDLFLPLEDSIELTDHEIQVSESLLQGVLQNWTSLQSKSIDALRETFLQRAGHIEENEIGWNLTVNRKSMDILVDWIPWSFSLIKLSWMEKSLAVNWQSDQYRDLMLTQP
jgi:hypothetical protein